MSIVNISSEIGNRESNGTDADFTIQLKKPLQKVIGMQLLNATIPLTYNIINSTNDELFYSYYNWNNEYQLSDYVKLRHGTHTVDELCKEIALTLRRGRINHDQRQLHIDNRNMSIPIGKYDISDYSIHTDRTRDTLTTIGHEKIAAGMTVTATSGNRQTVVEGNSWGEWNYSTLEYPDIPVGESAPGHSPGDLLWILERTGKHQDTVVKAIDKHNYLYGASDPEWEEFKANAILPAQPGGVPYLPESHVGWKIAFTADPDIKRTPGYDGLNLTSGDYELAPERLISFYDKAEARIIIAFNPNTYDGAEMPGSGKEGDWRNFAIHFHSPTWAAGNSRRILKTIGFHGDEYVRDNSTVYASAPDDPKQEWHNMRWSITGTHPPQPAGPGMLFLRIGGDVLLDQQNSETHLNDRIPIPVDQPHGHIVHYESDHEADIIPFSVPCDVSRITLRIEYGDDNQVVGGAEALGGHETYFRIKFYKQHAKNGPHNL